MDSNHDKVIQSHLVQGTCAIGTMLSASAAGVGKPTVAFSLPHSVVVPITTKGSIQGWTPSECLMPD